PGPMNTVARLLPQTHSPHPSETEFMGPGLRRDDSFGLEAGFTLIEMLVALAIFSLAALALLRLGGATATNSASLSDQAIAQLVARNLAVETITDPQPPAFGASQGDVVNAGRRWRWTRTVARSPE